MANVFLKVIFEGVYAGRVDGAMVEWVPKVNYSAVHEVPSYSCWLLYLQFEVVSTCVRAEGCLEHGFIGTHCAACSE